MDRFPWTKNIIAFRNKALVINHGVKADVSFGVEQAATVSAELMQFGYMLSPEAYKGLTECSAKFALSWVKEIIYYLKHMTAGDASYKPLHAGFPQSVAAMSCHELYGKAIAHYWSNGKWYPDDQLKELGYEFESVDYKIIDRISDTEFEDIFKSLAQVGTPLTEVDFSIIEWFVKEYGKYTMPDTIPVKENLCMIAALGANVPVKTPTDVLRIATYLSNGTTDLIMPPKKIRQNAWSRTMIDNPEYVKARFKKFNRSERRYLLSLIDKVANTSEMVLRKERWIRLGEILHPGEYSLKYKNAYKAFDALRNEKVRSWFGKLDEAFDISPERGLSMLSHRPGEFARRLDSLMRNGDYKLVLKYFSPVAVQVSNKVLFELLEHFNNRMHENPHRQVFIKGARRPTPLPTLEPLSTQCVLDIEEVIWDALRVKFSRLEDMGKIYIEPELENIPIPKNMKTLTDSLKVKVRGTRTPLKADKKVLRAYLHWTAGVDLDLSMEFATPGKGRTTRTTCSYHNLRPFNAVLHSGDVIPRHTGKHAEYIDIDLANCPYKYGLITVHNFSGTSLASQGAVLGFMEREHPEANPSWYPKTITDSYRLDSEGNNIHLAIIDFETKEMIFIDRESNSIPISTGEQLAEYVESLCEKPKVSVKDLLTMHAETRGILVEDPEEADIVFKFDDFCTSYTETLKYML